MFDGQLPFALLKTLDTGPISNHVNIVRNANGMFAYVTIGGLNEVKVFRTDNPAGAAIVNAIGPIRQVVRGEDKVRVATW